MLCEDECGGLAAIAGDLASPRCPAQRAHVGEASLRRGLQHNWAGWRDDPRAVVLDNSGETVDATRARVGWRSGSAGERQSRKGCDEHGISSYPGGAIRSG